MDETEYVESESENIPSFDALTKEWPNHEIRKVGFPDSRICLYSNRPNHEIRKVGFPDSRICPYSNRPISPRFLLTSHIYEKCRPKSDGKVDPSVPGTVTY